MNNSITLSSLIPKNTDTFYTYKGSLTSPPCNEVVTWIIFSMPVKISFRQVQSYVTRIFNLFLLFVSFFFFNNNNIFRQMNRFRTLSNGEDTLADNYRQLQEIGMRKVFVRRLDQLSLLKNNMSRADFIDSNFWFWH